MLVGATHPEAGQETSDCVSGISSGACCCLITLDGDGVLGPTKLE